jgi:hypothetical protein
VSPRLLLPLSGLAMLLAGMLVVEFRAGALEPVRLTAAPDRQATQQAETPAGAAANPRRDLQARVDTILQRPLFRPDRRPVAGAASSGPAALPRLSGILLSKAGKSLIFAGTGTDGKPIVVAEGGRIGLYTVQSIDAGQATVVGPEGIKVLQLSFGPPATPPPAMPKSSVPEPPHNRTPASGAVGRAPLTGAAASPGTASGSRP